MDIQDIESQLRALCIRYGWRTDGDVKVLIERIQIRVDDLKSAIVAIAGVGSEPYLDRPGSVFPRVPVMDSLQVKLAERGICPTCRIKSLQSIGTGNGMKFTGCGRCRSVVILPYHGEESITN